MDQWDDYTQNVATEKNAWDSFANLHSGKCKLIRTIDHVYDRLELTIPRVGYEVVFEESDKQNWRVCAMGPCTHLEPFCVAPRGIVDSIGELLHQKEICFSDPVLKKNFTISGKGSDRAKIVIESSNLSNHLSKYLNSYLALFESESNFVIKFVLDPKFDFDSTAESTLTFLDVLVPGLFSCGVLA